MTFLLGNVQSNKKYGKKLYCLDTTIKKLNTTKNLGNVLVGINISNRNTLEVDQDFFFFFCN